MSERCSRILRDVHRALLDEVGRLPRAGAGSVALQIGRAHV